jgi:hypothetical protein
MVQLSPHTDLIAIALDAERRKALDEEVMGLGIRNKTVLSWLERWRYDWPTHPFLVAGFSVIERRERATASENESAAGGLARNWDDALVFGQAVVDLFNALAAQRADKSRKLKAFFYLALTEPREREFEHRLLYEKLDDSQITLH